MEAQLDLFTAASATRMGNTLDGFLRLWLNVMTPARAVATALHMVDERALAHKEADGHAINTFWLIQLHPMAGSFYPLVPPRASYPFAGPQHLSFSKVSVTTTPDSKSGRLDIR
jgi:hypothetical protein